MRIPLVLPFRTATSATANKDALLVRLDTDRGSGWGECVATETPSYLPETIDSARLVLRDVLLPRVFAGREFDDVVGNSAARAALECALLDARLRADGVSLASYLGATRTHVDAGVAVGLCESDAELRALVAHYVDAGYTRVKCKIAPGRDVNMLRAVRADVRELAADANGSYTLADIDTLLALDELALQCLEQPLAPDALWAHATVAPRLRTKICLDETVTSANVARDVLALGAGAVVSVKPGRLGGVRAAVAVDDVCAIAGKERLVGGMLETGIGRAALLALAARPGFALTGDISASDRYFGRDGDLTEPHVLESGRIRVPTRPGLGVDVRPEQLARYTIAQERITP